MPVKYILAILIYSGTFHFVHSQKLAIIEVEVPGSTKEMNIPVAVNLDEITFLSEDDLSLTEVMENKGVPVSFQIENGSPRQLHWVIQAENAKPGKVVFELTKGSSNADVSVSTKIEDGTLILHSGDRKLLQYYYKTMYPPDTVKEAYKRSGFIHPLWSPHGQVLTRVQPPDHFHHYGIWNPWTKVLYKGDTIDFWNIGGEQGTVRFANFVSTVEGSIFGEYNALHEHVVLKNKKNEVAINELQSVRIYQPQKDYYIADITINLNCATQNPVTLLEYRYGGFGWRTTEQWHRDNSEVLTSEGKNRKEADGTNARWCIVQGEVDNDYAGVVMMSYPTNYNHPEPLRIWPETMYDRGDMFANFSPTRDMDWLLKPGNNYQLKYRLLVFNGRFTKEQAEAAWQVFSNPPKVTVKKTN